MDDSDYTMESALRDNAETLEMCKAHHVNYRLIDDEYSIDFEL